MFASALTQVGAVSRESIAEMASGPVTPVLVVICAFLIDRALFGSRASREHLVRLQLPGQLTNRRILAWLGVVPYLWAFLAITLYVVTGS